MATYKQLISAVILIGMTFALPRLAIAVECEGNECEPPPQCEGECEQLSCPQSLDQCQTHDGPATLIFNRLHKQSSLAFFQAFVDVDDLGDPTFEGGTDYEVCIYQDGNLLAQWGAPAGEGYSFIGKKVEKGIRFRSPGSEGMKSLLVKPDTHQFVEHKLEKKVPPNGRLYSSSFSAPLLPLNGESNVTAAFLNSNTCWSTTFGPQDIVHNFENNFVMKRRNNDVEPE